MDDSRVFAGIQAHNERDVMNAVVLKLTPLEREILNHRLEVPDAIADALMDNDDYSLNEEDIENAINKLYRGGDAETDIEKLVLWDCVDGSTYGARSDEITHQKQAAIDRAGDSLARKVSAVIGKDVYFRHC